MFETHDNDPHTRPGISPSLLRCLVCALVAAATVLTLGALLSSGAGSCPADSGLRPSTGLDGRTVCVSAR